MHLGEDPLDQLHLLRRRRRLHQGAEQRLLEPLVRLHHPHQPGEAQHTLLRGLLGQGLGEGGQGVLVRGAPAGLHPLQHHPRHRRLLRPDRGIHQGVVRNGVRLQILHRIQQAKCPVEVPRDGAPLDDGVVGHDVQQPCPGELLQQGRRRLQIPRGGAGRQQHVQHQAIHLGPPLLHAPEQGQGGAHGPALGVDPEDGHVRPDGWLGNFLQLREEADRPIQLPGLQRKINQAGVGHGAGHKPIVGQLVEHLQGLVIHLLARQHPHHGLVELQGPGDAGLLHIRDNLTAEIQAPAPERGHGHLLEDLLRVDVQLLAGPQQGGRLVPVAHLQEGIDDAAAGSRGAA
mmetsp:Transcript_28797/g.69162  ORF Transcript_28797/g.69162 Transcript_28797/m.69162 type:complete len:344 (-) Transcript_28797:384-1415(-)